MRAFALHTYGTHAWGVVVAELVVPLTISAVVHGYFGVRARCRAFGYV